MQHLNTHYCSMSNKEFLTIYIIIQYTKQSNIYYSVTNTFQHYKIKFYKFMQIEKDDLRHHMHLSYSIIFYWREVLTNSLIIKANILMFSKHFLIHTIYKTKIVCETYIKYQTHNLKF